MNQRLFLVRVVHDRAHTAKHRSEEAESECGIALCGGNEHGAAGEGPRGVVGVVIPRAEYDDVVELVRIRGDAVDQGRTGRALALQPFQLIVQRVRPHEDLRRTFAEIRVVALSRDGKTLHGDTVDRISAGWKLVAPRHIVTRASGQHAYVRVTCKPLGDVSRMQLGTAIDVGAVPLNHDGKLHSPTALPDEPDLAEGSFLGRARRHIAGPCGIRGGVIAVGHRFFGGRIVVESVVDLTF